MEHVKSMVTLVRQSEKTCLSANEVMRLQPMDLLTSLARVFCVHLSGLVIIPRAYVRIIYKNKAGNPLSPIMGKQNMLAREVYCPM